MASLAFFFSSAANTSGQKRELLFFGQHMRYPFAAGGEQVSWVSVACSGSLGELRFIAFGGVIAFFGCIT